MCVGLLYVTETQKTDVDRPGRDSRDPKNDPPGTQKSDPTGEVDTTLLKTVKSIGGGLTLTKRCANIIKSGNRIMFTKLLFESYLKIGKRAANADISAELILC